jgi:LPS-assembly protein
MLPRKRWACAALVCAGGLSTGQAADTPGSCPEFQPPARALPGIPRKPAIEPHAPLHVQADRAESRGKELIIFTGNVELRRGELHIDADELRYDKTKNSLDASGNARLRNDAGDVFLTPRLDYRLDTESGAADTAGFRLGKNNARGDAGHVDFRDGNRLKMRNARYTTCPPGQNDWFLKAERIELDKDSATGRARNVVLEFMHVPVFYFPYFSFPLSDERQSGFLAPRFGYGNKLGFVAATPYYLNLAPNYDATLTPRYMSRRGLQLQSEFRYLGAGASGLAEAEYLPNDDQTGAYRAAGTLRYTQYFSPYWQAGTDLQWASDINYFIDLGETARATSRTHLPRIAQLNYGDAHWRFSARATGQQTLDASIPVNDRPYWQLPQLLLSGDVPGAPGGLRYQLDSEWTYFDRSTGVTGSRLDLQPTVSLPLRTSYSFFIPKVGVRYTAYNLSGAGEENPSRGLPIASLDSGLVFERRGLLWDGAAHTQTLEPRLFYVRIPHKDQDTLPVFDTALPDFGFYNLFRENRFIGGDRVGDADQATLAVTSRLLNETTGVERLRVSLGEVFYFSDRRVNLPAGTVEQGRSNTVGELQAMLAPAWYLRGGLEWDNAQHATARGSAYLHYRPAKDKILNLGYRYGRDLQEQVDISGHWPLAAGWTAQARWNYSLPDALLLQTYAGLSYSTCCWALRAGAQHRILPDGRTDNSVLFEFELTGLAKLGKSGESPLDQGRFIFE